MSSKHGRQYASLVKTEVINIAAMPQRTNGTHLMMHFELVTCLACAVFKRMLNKPSLYFRKLLLVPRRIS